MNEMSVQVIAEKNLEKIPKLEFMGNNPPPDGVYWCDWVRTFNPLTRMIEQYELSLDFQLHRSRNLDKWNAWLVTVNEGNPEITLFPIMKLHSTEDMHHFLEEIFDNA